MCNFQALDDVLGQDMCDHGALRIFTYLCATLRFGGGVLNSLWWMRRCDSGDSVSSTRARGWREQCQGSRR